MLNICARAVLVVCLVCCVMSGPIVFSNGVELISNVVAQEQKVLGMSYVSLPESIKLPLMEAFEQPTNGLRNQHFEVVNVHQSDHWVLLSIAKKNSSSSDAEATSDKSSSLVLAHQSSQDIWKVAFEGTDEFTKMVLEAPTVFLDQQTKNIIGRLPHLSIQTVQSSVEYKFPWPEGASWQLTRNPIWHEATTSTASALDFGTFAADKRLLVAATGTVTKICMGGISVNVYIQDADGITLEYAHIEKTGFDSSIFGKSLPQGYVLGSAKPGTWSDSAPACGTESSTAQSPTYAHLHWAFPKNKTFVVDGCTITYPINYLLCGGIQKSTGSAFLSSNKPFSTNHSDYNGDGKSDFYAIDREGDGTNSTEIHILDGANDYKSWLLNTGSVLSKTGMNGDWAFALGDYNGDGKPDLYAISKMDAGSNSTAVHILNGADNYTSYLLNTGTPLYSTGTNGEWAFAIGDYNGDGKADLYTIDKEGDGSNSTEIHILNGADKYQSWLLNTGTPLHKTETSAAWAFDVADYNGDGKPDLYVIDKEGIGTKSTEVSILNGADKYQSWLLQTGTPQHQTGSSNEWAFVLGDYDGDSKPDLYTIDKIGDGTNSTEIHILSGVSKYQAWLLHTGTPQHMTYTSCEWDFATGGDCVVPQETTQPTPAIPTPTPVTPSPTSATPSPTPPPSTPRFSVFLPMAQR